MKKKILAIVLCVAMLAIAVVGGTMAYFTDSQAATNTFTVGSVEIELLESTLHRVVDNATDDAIKTDAAGYAAYLAENGTNIMPGRSIRKAPYVVNTGKNDAYVRVRLLIPAGLFVEDGVFVMATTTALNNGDITGPVKNAAARSTIDGVVYDEFVFTYKDALKPGEMTYWPAFWQVGLDATCDNDDIAAFLAAGLLDANYAFNILVEADAIQAEGFTTAAEAFAKFN